MYDGLIMMIFLENASEFVSREEVEDGKAMSRLFSFDNLHVASRRCKLERDIVRWKFISVDFN